MGKKSYFYHIEYEDSEEKRIQQKKQVISGFTCMENDRLFELTDGPELQTGDRIVYEKVGAYTLCLAPLFIGYYPPVYLEERGKVSCIRHKWGVKEYVSQSVVKGNDQ